jgi:ATPase subunit of ABC transporter with duplicated ATPase domains
VGRCGGKLALVSEPLLDVKGLVAGYGEPVVGPLSFAVRAGEIVGLTGPNGCGKSTILRAIIGSVRVFSGSVVRRAGTRVMVQTQRPVKLPEMPITGHELLHLTRARDRDAPPALQPLLDPRVDRLSGGQFQLLQVWAALGSPADLIYLDEPTNNMDPGTIETLGDLLLAWREQRGVLVVTHEHEFLERIATTIVEVGA